MKKGPFNLVFINAHKIYAVLLEKTKEESKIHYSGWRMKENETLKEKKMKTKAADYFAESNSKFNILLG